MQQLLFIAVGGALGALARYGLATRVHALWGGYWPVGTLLVNAMGSLAIGVIFVLLERSAIHPDWRSVVMVGFLGAFTTFSTFSLETVELWERGHVGLAVAYGLGSTVLCVCSAAVGVLATRAALG